MTGNSGCEPAGRTSLERPDWYADTPVEVEVTSLETFATAVREELEQNVAPYREKILQLLSGVGDTGGGGSVAQTQTLGSDTRQSMANRIGIRHLEYEDLADRYLTDLVFGMQAVVQAATAIAGDYQSADERNAMSVGEVTAYFEQEDSGLAEAINNGRPTAE